MTKTDNDGETGGFENVFQLVGGHGRFQLFCLGIWSFLRFVMTWNDLSYMFLGAVPAHWCHIPELENSSWTEDQIKNISIRQVTVSGHKTYDQCQYIDLNFPSLLKESGGNFEHAYNLVYNENNGSLFNPTNLKTCQSWTYDQSMYDSTIVTELNLVCSKRYLVASIQAFYMTGALAGYLIFGPLNDKILGRRRSVLISVGLVVIGGIANSHSTSYMMFIASRFLIASGSSGCDQAAMIWFLEHCDTKSRAKYYCIGGMSGGVGYAVMPVYAYYFRTWNSLQLSFTISTLGFLPFYWVFSESPRWLASHGRVEEAVQALEKIAIVNKIVPLPNSSDLLKFVKRCRLANKVGSSVDSKLPKANCIQSVMAAGKNFAVLFSTPELRRISVVIWIQFVAITFIYFGFAFTTPTLSSNPYLMISLGALMEVPASILPLPFMNRWGRRPTISVCYIFTGLATLSIALTSANYQVTRNLLSLARKLFVASALTVIYIVGSEAYPTVVRSTGHGAGEVMGGFGSMAAPYVADMLTTMYPDLPSVIFGMVALVAAVVALFFPETKDVDLKDQVDKGEKGETEYDNML